jgi:hypothetical protein
VGTDNTYIKQIDKRKKFLQLADSAEALSKFVSIADKNCHIYPNLVGASLARECRKLQKRSIRAICANSAAWQIPEIASKARSYRAS